MVPNAFGVDFLRSIAMLRDAGGNNKYLASVAKLDGWPETAVIVAKPAPTVPANPKKDTPN